MAMAPLSSAYLLPHTHTLHLLKVCLQVLEILLKLSYVLVFVFAMVNLQAHTVVWRA